MRMRRAKAFRVLALAIAGPIVLAASPAQEEFQARLLGQGAHYSSQAEKFMFVIDGYSDPREVLDLAAVLSSSGYEPFMTAFRGLTKGYVRPAAGRGVKINIHVAHSLPTKKGRKIVLFTQRQSWDAEAQQRTDPRFTFMVFELNVDKKGNGDGKIYEQARVRISEQGMMELESYNATPLALWGVRLKK
jgi:hypothetical protein